MNESIAEHAATALMAGPTHADPHGARDALDPVPQRVRGPRTLDETGLPPVFVARLMMKSMLLHGKSTYAELAARHCVGAGVLQDVTTFLVREQLAEISHRGATDADVTLRLTHAGRLHAHDELARCSYSGPLPVPVEAYTQSVHAYSVHDVRVVQSRVREVFREVRIDTALLDSAAASLNAGRPLMLYGPAGSGKTFIAERLGHLLRGDVPVPYALYVGGEIVQLYDPLVHRDAAQPGGAPGWDARWRWCRRPVVISGGELTLEALDLQYDAHAGFYQAPPHLKANMGLYVVDDLGRQRVEPHALLNRWVMPLDRRIDLYTLHSGARFTAPFDVWAVFSSNLDPAELGDEAFLRRLGSKLHVGALSIDDYRAVFEACCAALGFHMTSRAFDYLLHELHFESGKPFLACYPSDLLDMVCASARYRGAAHEVTEAGLLEAWERYFGPLHSRSTPVSRIAELPARKRVTG
jgi:hypothetical protein